MHRTVPGIGLLILGVVGLAASLLSTAMQGLAATFEPHVQAAVVLSLIATAIGTGLCASDQLDDYRMSRTGSGPPPGHPDHSI